MVQPVVKASSMGPKGVKAGVTKELWDALSDTAGIQFTGDRQLYAAVRRLSTLFTEERKTLGDYFEEPSLRKAYLGYYVPLNFAKVRFLLDTHGEGTWPPVTQTLSQAQHWVDLGCGPGTATLAALTALRDFYGRDVLIPEIIVDLVDTQAEALELASSLVRNLAEKLRLRVRVNKLESLPAKAAYDLSLAANVLNELPAQDKPEGRELMLDLWDRTRGTMLIVEPGHRVSSQRLIRFRERLLRGNGEVEILGPCLHAEKCPVYRSKHWCHFSEPVQDSKLIDLNMRIFSNPRGWLKFSYLAVRRGTQPVWDQVSFRAIGDLHFSGPGHFAIDLCQPTEKFVLRLPRRIPEGLRDRLVRGAVVWVK